MQNLMICGTRKSGFAYPARRSASSLARRRAREFSPKARFRKSQNSCFFLTQKLVYAKIHLITPLIFLGDCKMKILCNNCGAYNSEESKFCFNCGSPLTSEATQTNVEESRQKKITCPQCGSDNIHFVTVQSSQNFDKTDACCGYLLCGPLGLLFGVKNKTETKTVRKCMSCNHEF